MVNSQWLGLLNCSFLEIHVGSQWLGLLNYPLLKIHEIHVSSQWLGLLNCSFLEIHKSPQAPQIHRSTESTEPGSSPDLLDLSYAAMQITHSALILLLQAAPDSTRSRSEESVCSQSHLFHTLTLMRFLRGALRHICVMPEHKLTPHRELHLWPPLYRT